MIARDVARVAALCLAAAAVVLARSDRSSAGPGAGDPALGRRVFNARCIPCHRADGSGGVKLGGNPTPNWHDPKHVFVPGFDDTLRACITEGRARSGMPAWGRTGQLTPAEIEHVIAYIHTFFPKR